jgi:hypothetical protein
MKLQKIAVIGLFALSFAGLSAGAAQAIDAPDGSQIIIDCAGGYEAVYTSDGSSGTCEPIATTYSEDISAYSENGADEQQVDVNGCWTNVDATGNAESYVCSRSAVPTLTSEEPIDPAVGCGTVVDENGVDNTVCQDVMYSTLPTETDGGLGTPGDVQLLDENGVPIMDKVNPIMYSSGLASGQPPVDKTSNLLAALGVLVAAAGAFGIGLSKERAAKK